MDANMQQAPSGTVAKSTPGEPGKKLVYAAVAVVIVVVAGVLIYIASGGNSTSGLVAYDNVPVPQSLIAQLQVPNGVSATIGPGFAEGSAKSINATVLEVNGKPLVFYYGTEWCPYCAVERWGLVIALLRFGNFTGLEYMTSNASDIGGNLPTFTFVNATYSSRYIGFESVEVQDKYRRNLQQPNAAELAILNRYDPAGGLPFVDIANGTIVYQANYNDPTVLDIGDWSTIAGLINNASSVQSGALVGEANYITAYICKADNNTPSSVCSQSYVTGIEGTLH